MWQERREVVFASFTNQEHRDREHICLEGRFNSQKMFLLLVWYFFNSFHTRPSKKLQYDMDHIFIHFELTNFVIFRFKMSFKNHHKNINSVVKKWKRSLMSHWQEFQKQLWCVEHFLRLDSLSRQMWSSTTRFGHHHQELT